MLEGFEHVGKIILGPSIYIGHPRAFEEYKPCAHIAIPEREYDLFLKGKAVDRLEGITGIGISFGQPVNNFRQLYPTLKSSNKMAIMNDSFQKILDERKYASLAKNLISEIQNPNYVDFAYYCKTVLNFTPIDLETASDISKEDAAKLISARESYDADVYRSNEMITVQKAYVDNNIAVISSEEEKTYTAYIAQSEFGVALWVEAII